jgi:hypothetical protein
MVVGTWTQNLDSRQQFSFEDIMEIRKPFNLKDALAGKKVEVRGKVGGAGMNTTAKVVKVLHLPEVTHPGSRVLVVIDERGKVSHYSTHENGLLYSDSLNSYDLFMSPPKMVERTFYQIVRRDCRHSVYGKWEVVSFLIDNLQDAQSRLKSLRMSDPARADMYQVATVTWTEQED